MTGRIEQQFLVSSQKKVTAPKQIDRSNTFPPTLFFASAETHLTIYTLVKSMIYLVFLCYPISFRLFQVCFSSFKNTVLGQQ